MAAIYVALNKLAGKDVPQEIILPLVQISQDDVDYWVDKLSADEYAAYPWDQASVDAAITAINAGDDAVAPAIK